MHIVEMLHLSGKLIREKMQNKEYLKKLFIGKQMKEKKCCPRVVQEQEKKKPKFEIRFI